MVTHELRQPLGTLQSGLTMLSTLSTDEGWSSCIRALKGDVHVESERGTGTTFLIELPFAPPL